MLCRDDINGSMFSKNSRGWKTGKSFLSYMDVGEESLENSLEILMKYLKGGENNQVFGRRRTKMNFFKLKMQKSSQNFLSTHESKECYLLLITLLNLK